MNPLFLVKTKQSRRDESGRMRNFNETQLVEAVTFGEAEEITIDQMTYENSPVVIVAMKHANIQELLLEEFDKNYDVKLVLTEETESGREVKTAINCLVSADTTEHAQQRVLDFNKNSVVPFFIESIKESAICEVFLYDTNKDDDNE
jgi:hypothetical protein